MEKIVNGQLVQKFDYNILGIPRRLVAGIPAESLHIQNQQAQTPLTAHDNSTPHSLGSYQAGTFNANSINGGNITGTSITIGGNFSVDDSGNAILNNANVNGELTATGGNIAGWQLTNNSLVGTANSYIQGGIISGTTLEGTIFNGGSLNIGSDSSTGGYYFTVSDTGQLNIGGSSFQVTNAGAVTISSGSINIGNGEFTVTSAGALTATSATITGAVNATSGTIGGFTINSASLSGSGLISGGTISGSTINLAGGSGSAFLTFDNTSGNPDASILEDGSNDLLIRAGASNNIYFQSAGGAANLAEISSGSNITALGGFTTNSGSVIQWVNGGAVVGDTSSNLLLRGAGIYFENTSGGSYGTYVDSGGLTVGGGISLSGTILVGDSLGVTATQIIFNTSAGGNVALWTGSGSTNNTYWQLMQPSAYWMWQNNNNATAMSLDEGGNGNFYGNVTSSTGTKSGIENTSQGRKKLYAMESPEVLYEDIGNGIIIDGQSIVNIDPLFLECIEGDYEVFLSTYGRCGYMYCEKKDDYFIVFCDQDISFSWRIIAHRINYSHIRMEDSGEHETQKYLEWINENKNSE